MGKIKRIKLKNKKYSTVPGESPGSVLLKEDALKPKIIIHSYTEEEYIKKIISSVDEIDVVFETLPNHTHWIDVKGLGDLKVIRYFEKKFKVHKLVLEDILNSEQRPKVDEYKNYLFAVSRMLYINPEMEIENEQISFILTDKVLVSFQETYEKRHEPIITRLKSAKGNIRIGGSSYMLYALMDIIVDNYFTLLYKLGEELETFEDILYRRPDKLLIYEIQTLKRAIIMIRRAAWPERDKINDIIRTDSSLITADTKTYFKDTYDHTMQIMDMIDSNKEVTTSLIEMNLAFQSNRMNQVMKVLTIISSIFIPLTFIAGIYGMNFSFRNPVTGEILSHNMPELYSENGYLWILAVMFIIAVLQLIIFWRKGWIFGK